MPKVIVEGVEVILPESGMYGRELKAIAKLPEGSVPYRIDSHDKHTVIEDAEYIELNEGDRIGSVTRFRAAGGSEE
jgi:hypothetical protein